MKNIITIGTIILLVLGGFYVFNAYIYNEKQRTGMTNPTALVSRGWKRVSDSVGTTFRYPKDLSTTYIHPADWPPQVQLLQQAFSCTTAGAEIERAGKTELRTINAHQYCVTSIAEGAAGSTYIQYAYAFPKDTATAVLLFSLRMVQCGNYDEPEQGMCEAERKLFNPDIVIDQIAQTVEITKS